MLRPRYSPPGPKPEGAKSLQDREQNSHYTCHVTSAHYGQNFEVDLGPRQSLIGRCAFHGLTAQCDHREFGSLVLSSITP